MEHVHEFISELPPQPVTDYRVIVLLETAIENTSFTDALQTLSEFQLQNNSANRPLCSNTVLRLTDSVVTKRKHEHPEQPLTEEEHTAVTNVFAAYQDDLREYRRLLIGNPHTLDSLATFITHHPELADCTVPLVHLLLSRDSIPQKRETLQFIGTSYTLEQTVSLLLPTLDRNTDLPVLDDSLTALGICFSRRNGTTITESEQRLLARYFDSFATALDRYRITYTTELPVAEKFKQLVTAHPWVLSCAPPALSLLFQTKDQDALLTYFSLYDAPLPLAQTIQAINRFIGPPDNAQNKTRYTDFVDTLKRVLVRRNKGESNNKYTDEEKSAFVQYFSKLAAYMGEVRKKRQGTILFEKFNDLFLHFPETAEYAQSVREAIQKTFPESFTRFAENNRLAESFTKLKQAILSDTSPQATIDLCYERFWYMESLFDSLSFADRYALTKQLNQEMQTGNHYLSILLNGAFSNTDSAGIHRFWKNRIQLVNPLQNVIPADITNLILRAMLKDPEQYTFQFGIFLSFHSFNNLSRDIQTRIMAEHYPIQGDITIGHNDWALCPQSESRLLEALKTNTALVVNDSLVVKMNGKMTALCVRTVTTENGATFVRGNWYSPTDELTQQELKDAFDRGHARLTLERGSWALMRSVQFMETAKTILPAQEVLQNSTEYAETQYTPIYPNHSVQDRRAYRISLHEQPNN